MWLNFSRELYVFEDFTGEEHPVVLSWSLVSLVF